MKTITIANIFRELGPFNFDAIWPKLSDAHNRISKPDIAGFYTYRDDQGNQFYTISTADHKNVAVIANGDTHMYTVGGEFTFKPVNYDLDFEEREAQVKAEVDRVSDFVFKDPKGQYYFPEGFLNDDRNCTQLIDFAIPRWMQLLVDELGVTADEVVPLLDKISFELDVDAIGSYLAFDNCTLTDEYDFGKRHNPLAAVMNPDKRKHSIQYMLDLENAYNQDYDYNKDNQIAIAYGARLAEDTPLERTLDILYYLKDLGDISDRVASLGHNYNPSFMENILAYQKALFQQRLRELAKDIGHLEVTLNRYKKIKPLFEDAGIEVPRLRVVISHHRIA